jgi:predicted alpha/beta superfamily hydrolase
VSVRRVGVAACVAAAVAAGCGGEPAASVDASLPHGASETDAGVGCAPRDVGSARARVDALLDCLRLGAAGGLADEATREAAIDATLADVLALEGGFPLAGPDGLRVVYVARARWDQDDDKLGAEDFDPSARLAPIRVFGSFQGWDRASAIALEVVAPGVYTGLIPSSSSSPLRIEYRFLARTQANEDVAFSDPLSRRFDFDEQGRVSLATSGPRRVGTATVARGHLERVRALESPALGVARDVFVYLPPGYERSATQRHPVLYMHDGKNLFSRLQVGAPPTAWQVADAVEAELAAGRIEAPIVVGVPQNDRRFFEYTHVPDDLGEGPVGGDGDAYVDFVADVVKPAIDARYRTRTDVASTAILGASLGGLISFHAGLRRPEVFGGVGGMSSTLGWGRFGLRNDTMAMRYAATASIAARGQRFYVDSGGGPPNNATCASVGFRGGDDNYCSTLGFLETLRAGGVRREPTDVDATSIAPDVNLVYVWARWEQHNESAWARRLHRPLRLFFPPPAR